MVLLISRLFAKQMHVLFVLNLTPFKECFGNASMMPVSVSVCVFKNELSVSVNRVQQPRVTSWAAVGGAAGYLSSAVCFYEQL